MKYKFLISLLIIVSLCLFQMQFFAFGLKSDAKDNGVSLNRIDFSDIKQLKMLYPNNIITIPSPDPKGKLSLREIILPEFEKYCHVAADSNIFRWIGASNRMFPWVGKKDLTSIFVPKNPIPPRIPAPNKRALLMMFKLSNGKFMTIMPLSGESSISWLETENNGNLIVDYGSLGTKPVPKDAEVPLLAWAIGDDVYESVYKVWRNVASSRLYKDKMSLRSHKKYPEPMKYLGWCTWEQYHRDINERIMMSAFNRIEESDIPVRWILIDDGHQTAQTGNRLVSMKPDINKFPNGWKPVIARKQDDKVKWIGIWHTLLMHWGNVSPEHKMPNLAPYLMPQPEKNISKLPKDNQYITGSSAKVKALIPKDNKEESEKFYAEFMKTVKNFGFDFIKTDNVSRSVIEYYGTANPARAHTYNVLSLEKACKKNELGLMNCSAQNTIGMLNATNSATMRTSPDYQKHNLATSKSQILQSVFNVLWLGQTLWPDHDMFHSSDSQVGEAMAITKAMSGGPIYLSDAPEDFNKDIIMPLCYSDGLLIRPEAPGIPLPESVFSDALYEKENVYKVISPLKNKSCAIAAYNLSVDNDASLKGKITPSDYSFSTAMIQPIEEKWKIPDEGLIIYDWNNKKGEKLSPKGYNINIDGFGHELFFLCPVIDGWSVIGCVDKYLSPSTVSIIKTSKKELLISMYEPGDCVLYCEYGKPKSELFDFSPMGNNFYNGKINNLIDLEVIKITYHEN